MPGAKSIVHDRQGDQTRLSTRNSPEGEPQPPKQRRQNQGEDDGDQAKRQKITADDIAQHVAQHFYQAARVQRARVKIAAAELAYSIVTGRDALRPKQLQTQDERHQILRGQ